MPVKVRELRGPGNGYYLVDHPGPGQKRRTKLLGYTEADRLKGEKYAAEKNREREQMGVQARERLAAKGPIRGEVALKAWWEVARDTYADPGSVDGWLKHHVVPYFGERDLRTLTKLDYQNFGAKIAQTPSLKDPTKTLGHSTVRNCLTVMSQCQHWLEEQPRLDFRAPVRGIASLGVKTAKSKGAPVSKRDAWSREEAAIILRLAEPGTELHDVIFAALHTGARYGELLALEWRDVDVQGGRIEIRQTLTRKGRPKPPKNGKPRSFKMAGTQIQAHLARMAEKRFEREAFRRASSERVFRHSGGEPWRYGGLRAAWQRLIRRAGRLGIRALEFHCWRHTYVSWALGAGVNPAFVAAQIGDTLKVMHENYEHFMPEEHAAQDGFLTIPASGGGARFRSSSAEEAG